MHTRGESLLHWQIKSFLLFIGDRMKVITIFGSLFTLGMIPPDELTNKKDAANMTFTELDIAKQDNQICTRKLNRQIQFEKQYDDIYRLLNSMSLTDFYHRQFSFE